MLEFTGLNVGGVLTFLKKQGYKKSCRLLNRTPVPKLTGGRLEQQMEYVFSSAMGSNDRRLQEEIARSWSYFIMAVAGN